mmetsp:Transcript_35255/g.85475  ORF Transcript_35255/g.85475 Transcript_35255/m.85475 type:complete len:243 (-) Transcript_35255:1972-2700(-)
MPLVSESAPLTRDNVLETASTTEFTASGESASIEPIVPDRSAAMASSAVIALKTLSPLKKAPSSGPKNSVAASARPSAKISSAWLNLGATASLNSLIVNMDKDGSRRPADPGRSNGNGISSNFGDGGRMSPRNGRAGGLGGVNATTASLIALRKICRLRMSTIESTSGSNRFRRLSESSDKTNLRPSLKSSPSSGTASKSTKAAPSWVATAPAALFNNANNRESLRPLSPSSPLYRTSCKAL